MRSAIDACTLATSTSLSCLQILRVYVLTHVYARASGLPDESFRKVIDATVSILKLDCPIDFV